MSRTVKSTRTANDLAGIKKTPVGIENSEVNYDAMTKKELVAYCVKHGFETKGLNKKRIIELLRGK